MARYQKAYVTSVASIDHELLRGTAVLAGRASSKTSRGRSSAPRPFICYRSLSGDVKVGDEVLVNTVALDLSLGTGGYDIVVADLTKPEKPDAGSGHIIKLRYTPLQTQFQCVEEDPRYKKIFNTHPQDLKRTPVVVCGVHSQMAPVISAIKYASPKAKVVFVMTDAAALPIALSDLVRELVHKKLIDSTITCGHAFGGDHECVNIYGSLISAVKVLKADVVVVSVGPGIVGTGTFYGHGAFQQADALSAAARLGGTAIGVIRASLKDKRKRHQGLSHHTLSVMEVLRKDKVVWPVPADGAAKKRMEALLSRNGAPPEIPAGVRTKKQRTGDIVIKAFERFGLEPETMGRKYEDDPLFFELGSAAGSFAAEILNAPKDRTRK